MLTVKVINNCQEFKDFTKNINGDQSLYDIFEENDFNNAIMQEIIELLKKCIFYDFNIYNIIKNVDFEILLTLYKNSKNILISCYLLFLIYLHDKNYENEFMEKLNELFNFYISNNYVSNNNIIILIRKIKYNCDNKFLKKVLLILLDLLKNKKEKNLYIIYIYIEILEIEKSKNILSKTDRVALIKLLKQKYLSDVNNLNFDEVICLERLLDLMIPLSNNKKELKLLEGKILFKNRNFYEQPPFMQKQLKKAVNLLENGGADFELKNKAKLVLEDINKKVVQNLKPFNLPNTNKLEDSIEKFKNKCKNEFEKIDNDYRLYHLIKNTNSIDFNNLKTDYEKREPDLTDFFDEQILDRNGEIITDTKLTEEEFKFLKKSSFSINNFINMYSIPLCYFYKYITIDKKIENLIELILIDNPICEKSRLKTIKNIIIEIFKKNIKENLRNLIAELEAGLRYFLRNHEIFAGNLDLNDILSHKKINPYREILSQYLTENYINTLEYLCCLKLGGNIRNEVMHGDMPPKEMELINCYYLSFLIIKLYLGFYFVREEKKEN